LSLTIVKIGGSLLGSADLEIWLSALLEAGAPCVIVPGGGAFADHVRAAQTRIGFDDATAHRMALLAMDQVAVLLASRSTRFGLAASPTEMLDVLARGQIAVWLPSAMVLAASDVIASWEATSDSLAAWLAGSLDADRLLVVKSCDVEAPVTAQALSDAGIVDPLFPLYVRSSRAAICVAGPASLAAARELLRSGGLPGVAVAVGGEASLTARS
jgi:dihydroneopterin aldolase